MSINGINSGYNYSYAYQSARNLSRLSSLQTTSYGAVSPVNRVSSVSSSKASDVSSSYAEIQSFLKDYESGLTNLESAASKLQLSSRNNVFQTYEAGASDESVAEVSGSYNFNSNLDMELEVKSTAQAQQNVSDAHYASEYAKAGEDMDFEIAGASGKANVSVSSTNTDGTSKTYRQMYQEAAKAINAQQADTGVKATVSISEGKFSLVLTAKKSGESNGFTVTGDTGAASGISNAAVEARDAEYTITEYGSTQTYHSDSNEISLLGGKVTATLKDTGKTSLYTGVDEDKVVDAVKDLVKQYNSVTELLTKNESRGTGAAAHLKSFNRGMADTKTLKAVGITYDKDGKLTVDEDKLKSALETNFETTATLIGGQFGIAEKAGAKADTALSDSVQRIVNKDLSAAVQQSQNSTDSGNYQYLSRFANRGAYNLSNLYTVGMLLNTWA